jgi:hypothetical protein
MEAWFPVGEQLDRRGRNLLRCQQFLNRASPSQTLQLRIRLPSSLTPFGRREVETADRPKKIGIVPSKKSWLAPRPREGR